MFTHPIRVPQKKKNSRLVCVDKQIPQRWIDDMDVSFCRSCKHSFSLFFRRHHCRVCGDIFCDNCTSFDYLPAVIASTIPESPQQSFLLQYFLPKKNKKDYITQRKARICNKCNGNMNLILSSKRFQEVLNCCISCDLLNMLDISNLIVVNTRFHNSCSTIQRRWNNLRNILPLDTLKLNDITLISANKELLGNLSHLRVLAGKLGIRVDLPRAHLSVSQAIEILTYHNRYCKDSLNSILNEPFSTIPLYFSSMSLLRYEILIVVMNHFPIDLKCDLYYRVKAKDPEKARALCTNIADLKIQIESQKKVWECLWSVTKQPRVSKLNKIMNRRVRNKHIPGLMKHGLIKKIIFSQIKRMKSKSKPYIIPLLMKNDKIVRVLLKPDNLLSDCVVLDCLKLMNHIFLKEGFDTAFIQTYEAIPYTETKGMVEIVEDCMSLKQLQAAEISVQNFIIQYNRFENNTQIRNRFIGSLAASTVASIILGINDRHGGNLMLDTKGHIFHIDFEYLMNKQPRNIQSLTSNTSFVVCDNIIDAIGGKNSDDFQRFKILCQDLYSCIRAYVQPIIMNLYALNLDKKVVTDHTKNAFLIGIHTSEAILSIIRQKIKNRSSSSDYSWKF